MTRASFLFVTVVFCVFIQTALTYTNLALNKPVYATSTDPYEGGYCCDEFFAVDGNYYTYWYSADSTIVDFVIDFEQPEKFSLIEISWYDYYYATEYEIFVSNDSFHWDLVYKENNGYYYSSITGIKAEARYLMLHCIESYVGNPYLIFEIGVYRECSANTACGNGVCCIGEGICSLSCPSDGSLCSTDLCIEGQCQKAFKLCSDGDPKTRDMCNEATGECESDVPICGISDATFPDESEWTTTGVGVYGASVTITPTLITIVSGNGGTGYLVTKTCYKGSGTQTYSSSYFTSDSGGYTFDFPFYEVDGEQFTFNPNNIDYFTITYQNEFCFGLNSTDLGFGGATWLVEFASYYQCDDGIECTNDNCNESTGECSYTDYCSFSLGDICISDYCVDGSCYSNENCNDYSLCTDDVCDDQTGACNFPNIEPCDDHSLCTNDVCEPTRGCVFTNILCDDIDECTYDSCDPSNGCSHTTINCDDGNDCTVDSCNTAIGCIHTLLNCNDNNICTIDSCNKSTNCLHVEMDCSDGKNCTVDSCNPTFPDGSQCVNRAMSCYPSNQCYESVCNETTTTCVETSKNCDDGAYCTIDSCDITSGCKHVARNCNDSNVCTLDSCNNDLQRCDHLPVSCNDNNLCTDDSCSPTSGCVHTNVNCDDSNACTLDRCVPQKGCTHTPISCDDGNLCTSDSCNTATGCVHTNTCSGTGCTTVSDCNFGATNGCDDVSCVNGSCLRKTSKCDDGNVCTSDSCLSGRCFHVRICN